MFLLLYTYICYIHRESIHVDAADKDGCTPLLVAARQGCTEAFARLLRKADLKKMDGKGKIALVLAAEADQSAILEVPNLPIIFIIHNIVYSRTSE